MAAKKAQRHSVNIEIDRLQFMYSKRRVCSDQEAPEVGPNIEPVEMNTNNDDN